MAEVVEVTIKTSLDKVRKPKETADGDFYSIMTSVRSQLLNTNCNLADVAHSLDKNLLKAGETKDEIAKLNCQVSNVKNELGKVSPLRALNGFDTLYSEEKRRRNNDENRLSRRY